MRLTDARQLRARFRLARLLRFYRAAPCRMSRVHLLAKCAVVLGRFCAHSAAFDAIGEALMPVDLGGEPRTRAWRAYAAACSRGRPLELRDELWIRAHMEDMERIRVEGYREAFAREEAEHRGARPDPTWRLLRQHMDVTLGARLLDGSVLRGAVAEETAIAESMTRALARIATGGWLLLAFYAGAVLGALLGRGEPATGRAPSDRRAALELIASAFLALAAAKVFRRGVRARDRGTARAEDAWPLIASVLGRDDVRRIDPLVVRFYSNPARFDTTASLDFTSRSARLASWVLASVTGQGLHEAGGAVFDARFRTFRRADGSMHFVRELYCGSSLRVFDSDFVVRERDGRPTLHEVFADLGVSVAMEVRALGGGALSIRGRELRVRGARLPLLGFDVEFVSWREGSLLAIDGHLRWRSRELGCIHYRARERATARPRSGSPSPSRPCASRGTGRPASPARGR